MIFLTPVYKPDATDTYKISILWIQKLLMDKDNEMWKGFVFEVIHSINLTIYIKMLIKMSCLHFKEY